MNNATAPAMPSAHIEAAVTRMFKNGWMRRISWATDEPFSSRYFPLDVESESDPDVTYRAVYDSDAEVWTCICTAGSFGRGCKHVELGRAWLGLRDIR